MTPAKESYIALYCTSRESGPDFHGFFLDEDAANAAMDSVEAELPIGSAVSLTWTMNVRNAEEIRNFMAALDARAARVTPDPKHAEMKRAYHERQTERAERVVRR